MTPIDAVLIIETADDTNKREAWQYLIDSGVVWSLQGFYGRTAQQLIEAGICDARTEPRT